MLLLSLLQGLRSLLLLPQFLNRLTGLPIVPLPPVLGRGILMLVAPAPSLHLKPCIQCP